MDETRHSLAIILNRSAYRENDSLVTAYTANYGKLTLIARGTRKLSSKLAGHIEPLTLADIMIINGKGFDYIGSAVMRESYPGIRADLNKLYYAGRVVGLFNRLVKEDQADEHLFFLLARWLEVLADFSFSRPGLAPSSELDKNNGELLGVFFSLKLLAELGYQPETYKCLSCGRSIAPGKNYFDLLSGRIVCGSCWEEKRSEAILGQTQLLAISDNSVKLLRFILANKFEQAEKLKAGSKDIKELANIIDKFILCLS